MPTDDQTRRWSRTLAPRLTLLRFTQMTKHHTSLRAFLCRQTWRDWEESVKRLLPQIHVVDQTATRIWFRFYPLDLAEAFEKETDPESLARKLVLMGRYRLHDHIDTSHRFLYGHRYWPTVKQVTLDRIQTNSVPADLTELISDVATRAAKQLDVELSLLLGISAVGVMTLRQVEAEAFRALPGAVSLHATALAQSPDGILKARARDDRQWSFGLSWGLGKKWTVTFDENLTDASFRLIHGQTLTGAAANDKRDHHLRNSRCIVREGPIPVQCRSAFCGTCWIGVLGGAEKLSPVEDLERDRIREFGYINTDDPKPFIRLACQSVAFGAVSFTIPPWNGIVGRFFQSRRTGDAPTGQTPPSR